MTYQKAASQNSPEALCLPGARSGLAFASEKNLAFLCLCGYIAPALFEKKWLRFGSLFLSFRKNPFQRSAASPANKKIPAE
jgi:hypothetical protein